jgi:farnesyl-diphosphate farnesyltransferase
MRGDENRARLDGPAAEPLARIAGDDLLAELLEQTSRTFALAIPLLPQPVARQVGIAYLLFRIADTFEDATQSWSRDRQLRALADFGALLGRPHDGAPAAALAAGWLAPPAPTDHRGYQRLLAETPAVLGAFGALEERPRSIIAEHTRRTAEGMAGWVARSGPDGVLELATVDDLAAYCYTVAGIVGEMLSELFILGWRALAPVATILRERAAAFGEALQLVNILKDVATDRREGRRYLPAAVDRGVVFARARRDLAVAAEYVVAAQHAGGPEGLVKFTALPVLLAGATLDRVERDGPGAKLSRPEVYLISRRLDQAVAAGAPAVPA